MKKFKRILKNRIFIFILGGLIFGAIGVSAATYFPSNQVTYDNKTSGLKSKDVQGALDELYSTCINPPGASDDILDNVEIVTSGDGLYEDEYEKGRYIYKGSDPNNYITFNGDKAGWRILSLENDKTIKIIKNESVTNMAWDDNRSENWAKPTSLNTYLNGNYYNSIINYYKPMIMSHVWYIGTFYLSNNPTMQNQINSEKATKWNGFIGLINASEYIRANSNKNLCGSIKLNDQNSVECQYTNWIMKNGGTRTITSIIVINNYNQLTSISAHNTYPSRPALYLSSDIKITGGNGSKNNPYTIE